MDEEWIKVDENVEKGAVEALIHIKILVVLSNVGIREFNTGVLRNQEKRKKLI